MKPIDVDLSQVKDVLGKACLYPNKETGRQNTGIITGILAGGWFLVRTRTGVNLRISQVAVDIKGGGHAGPGEQQEDCCG